MPLRKSEMLRLLVLAVVFGINSTHAAQYFVSTTGNDAASGLSGAPWRTLQKAANQVTPGDKVTVLPGDYTGFNLTRSGAPPLNGQQARPIEFLALPGVHITERNSVTNDGINLEGASYIVIDGFNVANMGRAGVRTVGNAEAFARHVTIRNVTATNNGVWGIFTGHVDDLLIEHNKTSGSVDEHGIYVSNSGDRPIIRDNTSWNNSGAGIHMNGDLSLGGDGVISNALISGNRIFNNGTAGGSGINMDGVQSSRIENNLIFNNFSSGISLYKIDGGAGASGNVVVNNTVHQPATGRWALNIQHDSPDNTVLNNILISDHSFRGAIDISDEALVGLTSDYNVVIGRFNVTIDEELGIEEAFNFAGWKQETGQDQHSQAVTAANYAGLFANLAANDYQLSPTSMALDTGTSQLAPLADLLGQLRPQGAGYDRGAYEYVVSAPGDFDNDGDVDGRDFLLWQRGGSPNPLSANDLADWQAGYNAGLLAPLQVFHGGKTPPANAVPEPPSPGLGLFLTLGMMRVRSAQKR